MRLGFLMSIGILLYFLWEIISAFRRLSAFRKPLKLLRHAFLWTSKIISRSFSELDFSTSTWAKRTVDVIATSCPYLKLLVWLRANPILLDRFARRFGVHISFFSVSAAIFSYRHFSSLVLHFRYSTALKPKMKLIVLIVIGIPHMFMSGFIGGGCFGLALSIHEVFRPFLQDLDDPYRERLVFEF
jgi:hypothetical protein